MVLILGVHAYCFATFARLCHALRHLAARDEMPTKQRTTRQHMDRLQAKGKQRRQQSQFKRRENKGNKASSNEGKTKAAKPVQKKATKPVQTKGKERQQSRFKRRENKGGKATATPNNAAHLRELKRSVRGRQNSENDGNGLDVGVVGGLALAHVR
jgi:hypothetical protein